jgi:hypothetical protein
MEEIKGNLLAIILNLSTVKFPKPKAIRLGLCAKSGNTHPTKKKQTSKQK